MTGVRNQVEDPVGLVTLDRAQTLNALTPVMLQAFRQAVEAAAAALLEWRSPSFPRMGA